MDHLILLRNTNGRWIEISAIESGVTELYKKIKAWKKKNMAPARDEEMEDAVVEDKQEEQYAKFEIAIVGGRKKNEDEEMTRRTRMRR
jgi:hypothetical protein